LPEVRKLLEERIRAVVTHQAASAGVEAEIEYLHLVPAIRNTPAEAAIAREAVARCSAMTASSGPALDADGQRGLCLDAREGARLLFRVATALASG
jgi:metal-dependent amidase/aminoacylase/carboxypeptidase family protein